MTRRPRITSSVAMHRILLGLFVAATAVLILAPIALVVPLATTEARVMSFPPQGFTLDWFSFVLSSPKWTSRIGASLQVAIAVAFLATALGTMTAVGLVRSRFRGRTLVYGLVLAPLIVPTVVVGVGMYFVMVRGWTIGSVSFGGGQTGSPLGLILAHTALALPYPVITVTTSLVTVDRNLELAAANLGAPPFVAFRRVTLPLIFPGVAAGLLLSFVTSWDEVIVATFLSSTRFATVPVELFGQVRFGVDPSAAAISTLLMGASATLLFVMLIVRRRHAIT